MSYGWLANDNNLPPCIAGVLFDPYMPTRREEYSLVADRARWLAAQRPFGSLVCVDVGSGVTPRQHVLPLILEKLGICTFAIDSDPLGLDMPTTLSIWRGRSDMGQIPLPDNVADMVTCISVLEHCDPDQRSSFAKEAQRLTRKGGTPIVTADEVEPESLVALFGGFEFGKVAEWGPFGAEHLTPKVSFAIGTRI